MTSNEVAVVVWTVVAAIGVLLSGAMISSRIQNLRNLHRAAGNGDREYRLFLARQDIRRSVVRHVGFFVGFFVGALFTVGQRTNLLERSPIWLVRNWIWLLVALIGLMAVNETADRWALHRIRTMYRYQHTEYHPDALEDGDSDVHD